MEIGIDPARTTPHGHLTMSALRDFLAQFHTPQELAEGRGDRLFRFLVRVAATPGIGPTLTSHCTVCGRTAQDECTSGRAAGRGGHIHEPAKITISLADLVANAHTLAQADAESRRPVIAEDIARIVKYCK